MKTFSNIAHHLKLENEHLEVVGLNAHAYIAKSSSKKFYGFKQTWRKSKKGKKIVQALMNKSKQSNAREVSTMER